jgi:adenylate kinase
MKKAVVILGPPGAGKSTQAELLASHYNLVHLDTGRQIELFLDERGSAQEKKDFSTGKLSDSLWVLNLVKQRVGKISQAGLGIVFSGSPRTLVEAFGDAKHEGLIPFLSRRYGRRNILIFRLNLPERLSIQRNSQRLICSVCQKSYPFSRNKKICPLCSGPLKRRVIDKPAIIKKRLAQYQNKTQPIFDELKRRGYRVVDLDGRQKPAAVFQAIKNFYESAR